MAAEFTVNVEHALEMEYMAGIERRTAAKMAADAADADLGSIAGGARATSAVDGGTGHGPDGGIEDEVFSVGTPDGNSPDSAAAASGEEKEEHKTMDALVREARLERDRKERGSRVGGGRGVEGHGIAGHRRTRSAANLRALDVGNDSYTSDDDRNRTRDRRGAQSCFDVPPIIRQADLKGDAQISNFRRTNTAVDGGTVDVGSATLPAERAATSGGSMADTSCSAPSSPTGRHPCSAATTTVAASAPSVAKGSLSPVVGSRGRASTVTGCGVHTADSASGDADAGARSRFAVGGGGGMGGESDGAESVFSSARPSVEYERDGRAKLPRFTSEHIASVLRGQPLGLELQLEAPNEDSLDDTVARASRLTLQDTSLLTPRVGAATGGGFNGTQEMEPDTTHDSSGEKGRSVLTGQPAVTNAGGSWKQLVFACLLLLFAGDGLRHRWKNTFGGQRATPAASRQASFGVETASDVGGKGGGAGHKHMFGTAFLPPKCQDPASGRTMTVWATPSGPCLSPALATDDSTEGMGGGGGPGCAASFRLCSVTEVVGDASDVEHGRRPERGEL